MLCAEIGCAPHLGRIRYLINAKVIFIHLSTINVLPCHLKLKYYSQSTHHQAVQLSRAQLLVLCCAPAAVRQSISHWPSGFGGFHSEDVAQSRKNTEVRLRLTYVYFCKMHQRIRCCSSLDRF
jgi:hypothetical protein